MSELSPSGLCSIEDVKEYVPALQVEDFDQDDLIIRLIAAASGALLAEAGHREIIALNADGSDPPDPVVRVFDVDANAADPKDRTLAIGDLASLAASPAVTIKRADGTTVQTVATSLLTLLPRQRAAWQPITDLRFATSVAKLACDWTVEVAGIWGFPDVPEDVRQACVVTVSIWLARDMADYSATFELSEGRVLLPSELAPQVRATMRRYRRAAVA